MEAWLPPFPANGGVLEDPRAAQLAAGADRQVGTPQAVPGGGSEGAQQGEGATGRGGDDGDVFFLLVKVPDVVVSCSFTILIISYYYYYYCGKTLRFARTRNERPGKPR